MGWGLAALALGGCQRGGEEAPTLSREFTLPAQGPGVVTVDPSLERSGRVTVEPVRAGLAREVIVAPCEVLPSPDGVADVATTVLARIVEWHVAPGGSVRAGAPVVTLDAPEVALQRAHLARARIDTEDLELRTREEAAMLPQGATSRRSFREAGAELARVRESGSAARRALAVAQAPATGASGLFTLRAPLSGVVARREGIRGAVVPAGSTLVTVVDGGEVRVAAHVPEESADIPVGSRAVVSLRGRPGTLTATVVWRAPSLDRATRTRTFHLRPEGTPEALSGLTLDATGNARIERAGEAHAVVVPSGALYREGTRTTVFVRVGPGRYSARAVVTDHEDGATVEIVEGLRAGEPVVVGGTFLVASEDARHRREAGE